MSEKQRKLHSSQYKAKVALEATRPNQVWSTDLTYILSNSVQYFPD